MAEETRVVIDLALLLLISGGLSLVFAKIKMPPIIGYLAAGIILGPTMLPALWVEGNTVEILSSIGIVLLMFYIGLETDVRKLRVTGSKLMFIVCLQMPLVVAAGYLVGVLLGMNPIQAIFLGAIISGTSTAVVVGVLKETKHIDRDMAKSIVTITIFEDVGQVLILTMAAPLLAGDSPALGSTVNMVLGLILFIGLAIAFGMVLVPRMLDYIGKRYSTEILLIVAVGLCFALAAISQEMGLSIAIGAFIMGMMISLSRFSHKLTLSVEPVKDLFMAVFFISIGLQISPFLIIDNIVLAVIIAVVFFISKITTIWLGCYIANMTARDSFLIATSLIAMGEFAFIIAKAAFDAGVVGEDYYSAVIGAALITMVAMPIITKKQPQLFDGLVRLVPNKIRCSLSRIDDVHSAASANTKRSHPARSEIKRRVSLLFVDVMVIVVVMFMFTVFVDLADPFANTAHVFNLLPQELMLMFLIVIMAPIIYNMWSNVKSISKNLTTLVMDSPKETRMSERTIYLIFANIGTVALILFVLIIVVPFLPEVVFGTVWTIAVAGAAIIIIYLSWDTVKRGYDKFCEIMTADKEEAEEDLEEGTD
ncbi:MAG: cation:proton antiporter [Methanomassiliicoccus sp.]|nr:cation:proton antiporter [Methanomassiliicoccus sp.]